MDTVTCSDVARRSSFQVSEAMPNIPPSTAKRPPMPPPSPPTMIRMIGQCIVSSLSHPFKAAMPHNNVTSPLKAYPQLKNNPANGE